MSDGMCVVGEHPGRCAGRRQWCRQARPGARPGGKRVLHRPCSSPRRWALRGVHDDRLEVATREAATTAATPRA